MSELERAKKYLDMIPDELRGNPNDLVQLLAAMVAKVEKLETERNLAWGKGYKQGRDDAHQTIVALQAEVEELTAARDAFEQMYLTAAYGSAALKQEDE